MSNSDTAKSKKGGLFTQLIGVLVALIGIYLGSIFLSILVELGGMFFGVWSLPGAGHAQAVMEKELSWLSEDFKDSLAPAYELVTLVLQVSYSFMIQRSGLEWLIAEADSTAIYDYVLATAYVLQTSVLRLAVIGLSLPAIFLFAIYAAMDGLIERDIRTWSGGYETSFVYHHAKSWIKPVIYLPILLYLSSPISIHPSIFVLVFALPLSYSLWLTAAFFKKYL